METKQRRSDGFAAYYVTFTLQKVGGTSEIEVKQR
jgi:hypothetical protein